MAKLMVFALRDRQSAVFQLPMCVPAFGPLVRELTDAVNDERNGMLYKHPEDYQLYRLGDFDDNTGVFSCEKLPDMVLDCGSLARRGPQGVVLDLPKGDVGGVAAEA